MQIFFIDWERSRGRIMKGARGSSTPVSVWRTIFMANEWNELQTVRKTSIELTLICVVSILNGAGAEWYATPQPDMAYLGDGELNSVLRFANVTMWFLVICYGQRVWKWAILERFFTEPPHRLFVDLCTLAKVSVIIFDDKYHGYYLHCRSGGAFADDTMFKIAEQLREENEFGGQRGLEGAPDGIQTFEIYVSAAWKEKYDQVFGSLQQQEQQQQEQQRGALPFKIMGLKGAPGSRAPKDKLIKASRNLNRFLHGFVDRADGDHEYRFNENTFVHRVLRVPPDLHGDTNYSLFYPDEEYTYDNVLMYGHEQDLMLMNILMFTTADLWFGNTLLSAFLTFGLELLVMYLRASSGQTNMAHKTMVDERFLI